MGINILLCIVGALQVCFFFVAAGRGVACCEVAGAEMGHTVKAPFSESPERLVCSLTSAGVASSLRRRLESDMHRTGFDILLLKKDVAQPMACASAYVLVLVIPRLRLSQPPLEGWAGGTIRSPRWARSRSPSSS